MRTRSALLLALLVAVAADEGGGNLRFVVELSATDVCAGIDTMSASLSLSITQWVRLPPVVLYVYNYYRSGVFRSQQ